MATNGAASDYLENALLNTALGVAQYTKPSSCYVGLGSAASADTITELTIGVGAYARQRIYFSSATSGYSLGSTADISFTAASSDWGNISYFGIYDALTGGNLLFWGQFDTTRSVGSGSIAKITTNNIRITMD